jgi:hypothetical protein
MVNRFQNVASLMAAAAFPPANDGIAWRSYSRMPVASGDVAAAGASDKPPNFLVRTPSFALGSSSFKIAVCDTGPAVWPLTR